MAGDGGGIVLLVGGQGGAALFDGTPGGEIVPRFTVGVAGAWGVGASIRVTWGGIAPLQPGGVTAKSPAWSPVVREPTEANTSVHMSSIGSR